jgi:Flp pilus assembly pilin Flp
VTYIKARFETREERGANLVEYILLVALIALLVIGAVVGLKAAINDKFIDADNCLDNASATTTSC